MRGLSRYEYKRTMGWLARYYTESGSTIPKLFSDSHYGYDATKSHVAAMRYLLSLTREVRLRTRFCPGRGICLRHKRERSGACVLVYDVSYTAQGHRKAKTFRVHHYSSQAVALHVAQTFRRQMEGEMRRDHLAARRKEWGTMQQRETACTGKTDAV